MIIFTLNHFRARWSSDYITVHQCYGTVIKNTHVGPRRNIEKQMQLPYSNENHSKNICQYFLFTRILVQKTQKFIHLNNASSIKVLEIPLLGFHKSLKTIENGLILSHSVPCFSIFSLYYLPYFRTVLDPGNREVI